MPLLSLAWRWSWLACAVGAGWLVLASCPSSGLAGRANFVFGVGTETYPPDRHISNRDIRAISRVGASYARLWIDWADHEPRRGRINFTRGTRPGDTSLDSKVRRLRAAGIEILATVVGSPKWACENPRLRGWDLTTCLPRKASDYQRFLRQLVSRYRGEIRYWELGNELNLGGANPARYAQLLRAAYPTVKAADPRARVLFADVCPCYGYDEFDHRRAALPWAARALASLKKARAFDAVAYHAYRGAYGPHDRRTVLAPDGSKLRVTLRDELLAYRQLLGDHGYPSSDLWITEFGWPGHDPPPAGDPDVVTEAQQAEYLAQAYRLLLDDPRLGFVKGAFYWGLRDLPDVGDPKLAHLYFSGLLRRDYSFKPAATAYRRLARER